MLKNVLASIGIGGMKVDTLVDQPEIEAGGRLSGVVTIKGGDVPQRIDAIVLELMTRCIVEARNDQKVHAEIEVAAARAAADIEVAPKQELELPFDMDVPVFAPLSVGPTKTALRTRLDVPQAIDPRDSDAVRILPNAAMRSVFQGMEMAGFRIAEVEVEHNPRHAPPFTQEFDFKPSSVRDWGVEEVEIAFRPGAGGGMDVLVTVDRRGGLFSFGGERGYRFKVPPKGVEPSDVAAAVRQAIGR
ncbi:sporulation protein [Caenispirillum salinarum]|uniref:sporulation protein n=1 Tax=Caenispirillum salinarum TaxID=859058 RepID=UPI00384F533D